MIYVLSSADRTCVKIGFSRKRPIERCESIEASHPVRLVPLLVLRGDTSVERHLHKRFEVHRTQREWFRKGKEIEDWLRVEEGLISQPFYSWLAARRHYDNPIGVLARRSSNDVCFPTTAKTYIAVEDHLRAEGASLEMHEAFNSAWREFLRTEVTKDLDAQPAQRTSPRVPRVPQLLQPCLVNATLLDEALPEVRPEHLARVVDLFDRLLPEALCGDPDGAQVLDTVLCFKIKGAGEWTIDCSKASCIRGASDRSRCTVELEAGDFVSMLFDPNAGMRLFFQKKLRISGDASQVVKIAPLFDLARRCDG